MPRLWSRLRPTIVIGIVVAVPTLVATGVYGWLFLRSLVRDPTLEHLIALLFLWQTETGAALAVAAALIGAAVVLDQTATTRRLEECRRARRATALRAVLPLMLTELADYAARCAAINARLLARQSSSPIISPGLGFPSLPLDIVGQMTDLISASKPNHAKPLIILMRRLQIHHARMRDTQRRAWGKDGSILVRANVVHRVIDSAEVYARCEKLFQYARSNTDAPAPAISPNDVQLALFLIPTGLPDVKEMGNEIDRLARVGENGARWPEI